MKDPTQEILKAYYNALNGNISYGGDGVFVGTKVPSDETMYVFLYIESLQDKRTGTDYLTEAIVTMDIVTRLDLNSGDEEIINDITDQVLYIVSDPSNLVFTNFSCPLVQLFGLERNNENTDTNYIASRKLRMRNFIQQK